jgi:hypothetical protein
MPTNVISNDGVDDRSTMAAGPRIETTGGAVRGAVEQGIHVFRSCSHAEISTSRARRSAASTRIWASSLGCAPIQADECSRMRAASP